MTMRGLLCPINYLCSVAIPPLYLLLPAAAQGLVELDQSEQFVPSG